MEKGDTDKMMRAGDAETKEVPVKREFFYPDHGRTIVASTQEEADKLLAKKPEGTTL